MAMSEEVKAKLRQHSAAKRKRERKMVDVTPGEVLCQIDWLEEAGRFKCYDPDKSMAASWFRYTPRAVIDAARTRMAHRWGVVARKDGHRVVPVFHYADLTTLLDRLQLDPKVRYYGTGRAYHATVYTNYHGQRRPDGTARPPLSVTAYWGKSWDKSRDTGELEPLVPHASTALRNHSPDGFECGYGGSGPAQLALAILLDATKSESLALAHYQAFKAEVVAGLPVDRDWDVTKGQVGEWLWNRGTENKGD
jgi:hypothetical protein